MAAASITTAAASANLHGYVEAVVRHWQTRHENQLRALRPADGISSARLGHHHAGVLALDHTADAAMRSWAATNPTVAAAQQRVDELWRSALYALLHDLIGEPGTARRLTVLGRLIVVGHQLIYTTHRPGELAAILADFEGIVGDHYRTGPTQR